MPWFEVVTSETEYRAGYVEAASADEARWIAESGDGETSYLYSEGRRVESIRRALDGEVG